MVDTQHFCLRWNNYQSSITSAFENLRDDEDFVDVTLACDGKSLKAHRVVLSACSPFFRELLKSTPCKHPVIVLQDVAWTDLHALVEFIYHGEVNVHQRSLSSFLKTAEVLRVSGLTQQHVDDRDQLTQVQSLVRSHHSNSSHHSNHRNSEGANRPLLHSPSPLTPPITNHHHGGAFPGDKMDEDRANSNHLFGGDSSPPLGGGVGPHIPTQLSHLTSTTTAPSSTLPHPTTTPTPPSLLSSNHHHHHHHHQHNNQLLSTTSSTSTSATVNQLLRRAALNQHRRERRSISNSEQQQQQQQNAVERLMLGDSGGLSLSEHHKRARAAAEHLLGAAAVNNNNVDMMSSALGGQAVQTQPTDFSPSGKMLMGNSMQLLKELSSGGGGMGAGSKGDLEGNGISSTDGNTASSPSSPSPTQHLNHIQANSTSTTVTNNSSSTAEIPSSTAGGGVGGNGGTPNTAASSTTTVTMPSTIKTEPMDLLCGSSSERDREMRTNHMDDDSDDDRDRDAGGGSRGTTPGPPDHRSSSHQLHSHHSSHHHLHHSHHHSSPPTPTPSSQLNHLPHHLSLHSTSGGHRQLLPPGPHSGGSSVGGDDLHHDGMLVGHDGVPPYLSADSKLFAAAAGAGSFNFSMAALAADPTGLGVLFLPGLNQSLQVNADSLAGTSQGALANHSSPSSNTSHHHTVRMPPPTQGGINEPQECPYCRRTFSCYYSLKRHFQDKHEQSDTLYVCEFCHRRYRTKNSLTTHKSLQHRGSSGMLKRLLKTSAIKSVLGAAAAASSGAVGSGGGGGGMGLQ